MYFNNVVITLIATGVVLLAGCREAPRQAETSTAPPVRVTTISADRAAWPSTYQATGTVRARTSATISSKVMGYVREVRVRAGDSVKPGDLLVLLDARDLDAAYRQAEAAVHEANSAVAEVNTAIAGAEANRNLARTTFQRMEGLFQKNSISNQEYDEASAKLKLTEAGYQMALAKREQTAARINQTKQALSAAEVMRGYSELKAPFAGVVTQKTVDPGSLATPGAPLLLIEQAGSFQFEASIEESMLPRVKVGQQVEISLESLDRALNGRISEILPSVDSASRTFLVKVALASGPQIRSGLFGRMNLAVGSRDAISLPAEAVEDRGQVQSVMLVSDGIAHRRLVTTGQRSGDRVEILSGLSGGERVVYPRAVDLNDGARVEVRP